MKRFIDWLKDDGYLTVIVVLAAICCIVCIVMILLAAFGVLPCAANGSFNTSQWVANPANPSSPLFRLH